ncbi:MAG: MMPL family transporter, partial [Candidatus Saccharimonadales bacterium]
AATFMITVYAATMITIFKLSATPLLADFTIVLTLAGIAGFIMSIAVAADANILVLERLREERAAGLKPVKAVEEGYNHAWSSIRDASVATMIITIILYVLARQFGELSIQGFALVLGIGVLTNVASVSIITRTVLRGLAKTRWSDKL